MKSLPKQYNHSEFEPSLQKEWEAKGIYHWDKTKNRPENFVIDTPPPTVSGLLHMGHIFSYTQADFVARFMRMNGKNVFYPMGFDDNGLPTERLVEKVKKVRATDMSREDFITLCEEVAAEARVEFKKLFQSVALSVDWNQQYSTISETSRALSQMSFLDLFQKEQAYRKLQPMLWDPVDQTAIAQAEVEDHEKKSFMNYIPFTCKETGERVTIATTRPELLGACVAVFYHPDDVRYQTLAGKTAVTALFGVHVPFLPDDQVKMDKGSGLVMCCTFGDETDIHWWRTHQLPTRLLLDKYAKLRPEIHDEKVAFLSDDLNAVITKNNCDDFKNVATLFESIVGLKVTVARDKIIELLKEKDLLEKQEPIEHAVKCAERSGAALEIIPTHQWFIKVLDHKEALKEKARECDWYPEYMRLRIEQWIDGLSWDWCISRQRYFGVPFPVWYSKRAGEEGKVILADKDQLPVNPMVDLPKGYSREEVEPECDVMDTWATSSISPQLNSGAINETLALDYERHQKLYPADLRPQAHEIIRTWAFYTIVKSYLHANTIPWKNLMISGWCLAADKTKMSKSKGNVVTPVHLIEEKGADVVRFWASTSKLGSDTAYSEDVLKIGKKLINKLWNATQFAAIHLDKLKKTPTTVKEDIASNNISETIDLWVLSKLETAITIASKEFERFEYGNARAAVEDFFWNDFCDNYLEIIKVRVYGEHETISEKEQQSAICTIYHCLDGILRLFAPFVPHITETLYSHIFTDKTKQFGGSIHAKGTWPRAQDYAFDEIAVAHGKACVSILNAVRKLKADRKLSIKAPIRQLSITQHKQAIDIDCFAKDLGFVTNSTNIDQNPNISGDKVTSECGLFDVVAIFEDEN